MTGFDMLMRTGAQTWPLRAPEGEGAGGAAASGDAAGGAGAASGAAGGADGGTGAAAGGASRWYQGADYSPEEQQWLASRGLTEDDPAKVMPKLVKGHRAAEQRLGRPADSLIDRPKEGQALTDWMREQKAVFNLPDAADGYRIDRPKDLPEGIAWNGEFEAAAKARAHELGLTQAQLEGMSGLYFQTITGMQTSVDTIAQAASDKMMADLERDWGRETPAKLAQARQAAGLLAEKAGLDGAAVQAVASVLSAKAGGDAATIRLFAALGEMMGEDRMVAGKSASMGMTPTEARARIAELQSRDGAWYKATASGDRAEMARLKPEIDRLSKLAAGQ